MFQMPRTVMCKLRKNMCKLVSILIVNESNIQEDALEPGIKYVISQLTDLQYTVKKVTVLESDAQTLRFELEHCMKQNDFVILIDKWNLKVTFTSVCEVFNTVLVVAHSVQQHKTSLGDLMIPKISKFLEYDNSIKLTPVLYLSRLFIVREANVKSCFDHILKPYLKKFNQQTSYLKTLTFKGCEVDIPQCQKKCGSLHIACERHEDLTTVNICSSELIDVVEYQRKLVAKYCMFLLNNGTYFLHGVYPRNSFQHIQKAVMCVEKALHQYSPSNIFLSFNGGKDCTVLLHLVLGVLREHFPQYSGRLTCMYIQSLNPFPEVNQFIHMLRDYYNVDIVTITKGVKEGLETFLHDRPHMKACLMGTRRTDPYSQHLHINQMTDPSWPQVMRISPLLDWHYSEIWDYLLYFQVPYCSLYKEGYTSLGSVHNTVKNPKLLYSPSLGQQVYLPAYKLLDGSCERDGRV